MRIPDETNRTAVVGATGTGKTHGAAWLLSQQDLERPWVIYNFKRESIIDNIPGAYVIDIKQIPLEKGVYIIHPSPRDKEAVDEHMWAIWEKENVGVFVDEGYMVGRYSEGYTALLTQGRSKQIPMINLSQRPVWLNPFVLDQSEFIMVFRLQKEGDRKKISEYIPKQRNPVTGVMEGVEARIPEFYSYYYDVARDKRVTLRPVPNIDTIYATFRRKLERVRKTV